MEIERFRRWRSRRLIQAGEITDAKTIIGLMLARERLANAPSTVT